MKVLPLCVALLGLTLGSGCDRMLMPSSQVAYAPWEEGLTLGFENPNLDAGRRQEERYQVRVKTARPVASGRLVVLTTTTLSGQNDLPFLHQDGGVSLGLDGDSLVRVLPKGFPDRTSRWEDRGVFHWVVGRATVQLPGVRLAEPGGATGVWVESSPLTGVGPRRRTLYLPDIGEAETLLWENGRWVCVFRLVSRGFTDVATQTDK